MDDDDFVPRLGGARPPMRLEKSYLDHLSARTGKRAAVHSVRNHQSRLALRGRGSATGSLLALRHVQAKNSGRSVTVKVSRSKRTSELRSWTSAHLRYIARNGVGRDGHSCELYTSENDRADAKDFALRSQAGHGHFLIILSPEDGDQLVALRPLVRRLMTQVEYDLGTKLDWLAADHFNTDRPHTHILLHGTDREGKPLLIASDYISHGFRERLRELMIMELGAAIEGDRHRELRQETKLDRLTEIDKRMISESVDTGVISAIHDDPFEQSLRTRRLRHLAQRGLAEKRGSLAWQLEPNLGTKLAAIESRLGRDGNIRRTLSEIGRTQGRSTYRLIDADHPLERSLIGRVVSRETDPKAPAEGDLLIEGVDDQLYAIDSSASFHMPEVREGTIIKLPPTIPALGGERGYQPEPFRAEPEPSSIEILSNAPLEVLISYDGPTFLDDTRLESEMRAARSGGFGREIRSAQMQRQQWLIEQGLVAFEAGPTDSPDVGISSRLLPALRQRELLRIADQLSDELGLEYVSDTNAALPTSALVRRIDVPYGRLALLEQDYQFRLVPWEPAFDMMPTRQVAGISSDVETPDWGTGPHRKGPSIS